MKSVIFVLAALSSATAASARAPKPYYAHGTEPFWGLSITTRLMTFTQPGRADLVVRNPGGRPSFNGMRYTTRSMTVDRTRAACNDGMSDRRYADTVTVRARGRIWRGCGGELLPPAQLAGTSWRLTTIDGRAFAQANRAGLRFEDSRLTVNAGCNGLGGDYRVRQGRLIAGPIIGTQMACPPPIMRDEQALSETLSSRPAIRFLPGGRLQLTGGGHSVTASLAAP